MQVLRRGTARRRPNRVNPIKRHWLFRNITFKPDIHKILWLVYATCGALIGRTLDCVDNNFASERVAPLIRRVGLGVNV